MEEITFRGKKVHVKGPLPEAGSQAPDFELVNQHLEPVTLESFRDQKKLLNVYISLDTSVCALSIKTWEEKVNQQSNLAVLNISMDLPFAASRFCHNENLENVITLSTFRSSFPDDYGVRITDGPLERLCARAVFLLDEENTILYRELVPEITQEPDYEAALKQL